MTTYIPRQYQEKAIQAGIQSLNSGDNGIIVAPTGSGKSIIIAEIIKRTGKKTIVLQPTKEILEQNLSKLQNYTEQIGIFSASMNRKTIGQITLATIGTIIKHKEVFYEFEQIIVDECHLVSSQGGQYEEFISALILPTLGLTATPYRMRNYINYKTKEPVVEIRFLTRTRPRIFKKIVHITQLPELFEQGYLCPVKYITNMNYDSRQIKSNSTGQGYDDTALFNYNFAQNITDKITNACEASKAKHVLIFTKFREESKRVIERLGKVGLKCEEVSGETPAKDRERILSDFKAGRLKFVVNVGTMTTGFDFPELDCIIIGRPTKSVALAYQMLGRGLRTCKGKEYCTVIDLCDNVRRIGELHTFTITDTSQNEIGLWRLKSSKGYLTGINLITGQDIEAPKLKNNNPTQTTTGNTKMPFGKHKGKPLKKLDYYYLQWAVKTFDAGNKLTELLIAELDRRHQVIH